MPLSSQVSPLLYPLGGHKIFYREAEGIEQLPCFKDTCVLDEASCALVVNIPVLLVFWLDRAT